MTLDTLPLGWPFNTVPLTAANNELQTAVATWWLVYGTFIAAIATFAAVVVALKVARTEGLRDRTERQRRDVSAIRNVDQARNYLLQICERRYNPTPDTKIGNLWLILGELNTDRRVLEHFLEQTSGNEELPRVIMTVVQRNYEVRDAISLFLPEERMRRQHVPDQEIQQKSSWTLGAVADRLEASRADFERVKKAITAASRGLRLDD